MRVVSLVPSLTELVWELDRTSLIGRTRFCTQPAEVREVPHFGGTKNPDVAKVVALRPDLVIANKEENRREDVEALRAAGLEVLLTDPNTVNEALEMIEGIGRILGAERRAETIIADARAALAEPIPRTVRVFVPIWHEPLMGLGSNTYGHDLLERCGAVNVLRDAARYPEVTMEAVAALEPDLVLLPDEPFRFGLKHVREYERIGEPVLVSGELLWWYGPRIGASVRALKAILSGDFTGSRGVRVAEPGAFGSRAADELVKLAAQFKSPVIGLPTGATPVGMYEELARRVASGKLDVRSWRPVAIDEYVGPRDHPGSNRTFFARYWDTIPGARAVAQFDPEAADLQAEVARMASLVEEAGSLDVAVLGIGLNGHLAFNEPGSTRERGARVVRLAEESRESAAQCWGDAVPTEGMTLGLGDLLGARAVLVLANGEKKADVVARAMGVVAEADCPASYLNTHPHVTWVLDSAAAGQIEI